MPKVFLSPSRHNAADTEVSSSALKPSAAEISQFFQALSSLSEGKQWGSQGGSLPQGCGLQEQFFHQQQSQSPSAPPAQRCCPGGCPYPQLSSSPAPPPDLPGGFRWWWFQPQGWFSEEALLVEMEEKKQHINRIFLFTAPQDSNPWQAVFSVASGGKAAIRRPKVTYKA